MGSEYRNFMNLAIKFFWLLCFEEFYDSILPGSKKGVSKRYWHHLWICWWWHVWFMLECFGDARTTHCDRNDLSGCFSWQVSQLIVFQILFFLFLIFKLQKITVSSFITNFKITWMLFARHLGVPFVKPNYYVL